MTYLLQRLLTEAAARQPLQRTHASLVNSFAAAAAAGGSVRGLPAQLPGAGPAE
jgi:hypothetical protein